MPNSSYDSAELRQVPRRLLLTGVFSTLSLVAWTAPLAMLFPDALVWLFGAPGAPETPIPGLVLRGWWVSGAWVLSPSLRGLSVAKLAQPGTLGRIVLLVPVCSILRVLPNAPRP